MISAAPATIRGTLIARPRTSSGTLPLAAAATAITLSRLMTMSATTTICTAAHRCEAASTPSSSSSSGTSSFAAITISASPPTSFRIRQLHQGGDDAGEDDAQDHGSRRAEDHAPQPLARRQPAARQRDHQRVVAGQQDVDPDDLADRHPEGRLLHLVLELGEERSRWSRDRRSATASSQRVPSGPAAVSGGYCLPLVRVRSADDFVAREELRDLDRRRLRRVGAMHRILADRLRVHLADGAVGRLGGIGGAHHVAVLQHGALAFQHLDHDRAGSHEVDQFAEERARLVDGVEGFGLLAGHANALLGHDPQSRLLDQRVDRAGQIARGRVGLDNRKGAFNRHDLVLENAGGRSCGAYIDAVRERQATRVASISPLEGLGYENCGRQPAVHGVNYNNFTMVNPF